MIKIGKLSLDTDFEYRIIREDDKDVDLFIDLNYRSLDIDCGYTTFFDSRIQFNFVRSLILRFNKDMTKMTIHLMKDIDLFSAFANFEVDYNGAIISIKNHQEKVILSKHFDV